MFFDRYKSFFIDIYGVLRGKDTKAIVGAVEFLETLNKLSKNVIILSNATSRNSNAIKSLEKIGIYKDKHFSTLTTSGEYAFNIFSHNMLSFKSKENVKNIYIFGTEKKELFDESKYHIVSELENADCIYISVPQLNSEDFDLDLLNKTVFPSSLDGKYDTTDISLFKDKIDLCTSFNIPVVNANPDMRAGEKGISVVRQGYIASEFQKRGIEVLEFGKPNKVIYEFASQNLIINKSKSIMIGDTIGTDILGARNFGIDSILVKSGISFEESVEENISLEQLCKNYNIFSTYVFNSIADLMNE